MRLNNLPNLLFKKMKTNKILMAVVALFISMSVMTAQVPAKKETKAEPAKKECCEGKTKAECKDAKKAECTDAKKAECKDAKKAECTDAKKAECKKDAATAENKSSCCANKTTAQM